MCCALIPAVARAPPEVRIRSAAWFPPSLTISADANLVELAATVRDRQGHLIGGLHASDFELLDDNQPREIAFFTELKAGVAGTKAPDAQDSPPPPPDPRTIALFFDDAHAGLMPLHTSAEAAEKLISNDLHTGDRVGIFTASGTVSVDFTGDRDLLLAALARLLPRPLSGTHPDSSCPTLDAWQAYAIIRHKDPGVELEKMAEAAACNCPKPVTTECRNAQRIPVQTAAAMVWALSTYRSTTTLDAIGIVMRHLAAEPGKRMLVLMSPGFPAGDGMESRTSALMEAGLRANIRIGTMKLPGRPPPDLVRNEFMGAAAKATGGQFLDGYYDPASSLRALTTEPEVSYVLGFSPPGDPDGQYHKLKTRIPGNRGYSVESRTAYYSAKAPGETAQKRIDRMAMSDQKVEDFPAALEVRQDQQTVRVTIDVDAKALRFPEKEGRHVEELTLLTVIEDAQGHFVEGKQSVMDLALTPATLAEKLQKGIHAATSFPLPPPGSYRVREVVREAVQDRLWAGAAAIEVH